MKEPHADPEATKGALVLQSETFKSARHHLIAESRFLPTIHHSYIHTGVLVCAGFECHKYGRLALSLTWSLYNY